MVLISSFFFFQAEDGIRDLVRSRGLGDVYKRQPCDDTGCRPNRILDSYAFGVKLDVPAPAPLQPAALTWQSTVAVAGANRFCLLYTSDAADERSSVDLGGRRIIKKQKMIGDS